MLVTRFATDFESSDAGFSTSAATPAPWQYGTPTAAPIATCNSGLSCWKTNLTGPYNASADQDLLSPALRRELAIKIGFNYGPVVPKGGDVFGDTVNVCARLVGIANPRQVLTTQQTVDALSPGLRKRCRTLPPTRLRGRTAEVAACEVLWRGDADVTELNLTEEMLVKAAQWVLKLRYGDEAYTVDPGANVSIGRDKQNDIVVPSQHASRLHARGSGRRARFPTAALPASGSEGLSHPALSFETSSTAAPGPLRDAVTLLQRRQRGKSASGRFLRRARSKKELCGDRLPGARRGRTPELHGEAPASDAQGAPGGAARWRTGRPK